MTHTTGTGEHRLKLAPEWRQMRCPTCGSNVQWVLARLGGGYSYQPCGCHGGTASK